MVQIATWLVCLLVAGSALAAPSPADSVSCFKFLYRGTVADSASEQAALNWELKHNYFVFGSEAQNARWLKQRAISTHGGAAYRKMLRYENFNNQKTADGRTSDSALDKFVEEEIWYDTSNHNPENRWLHYAESTLVQCNIDTGVASEIAFGGNRGRTSGSDGTRPQYCSAYRYAATTATYTRTGSELYTNVAGVSLATIGDILYLGNISRFFQVAYRVSSLPSSGFDIAWEYWNGTTWATLSFFAVGGSEDMTTTLNILSFIPPPDWDTRYINYAQEMNRWWVRARVVAAGTGGAVVSGAWHDADCNFDGILGGWRTQVTSSQRWCPGWYAAYDINGDNFLSLTEYPPTTNLGVARLREQARVVSFWWGASVSGTTERWCTNVGSTDYITFSKWYANLVCTLTTFPGLPYAMDGIWEDNRVFVDGAVSGNVWDVSGKDSMRVSQNAAPHVITGQGRKVEYPSTTPGGYYQFNIDQRALDSAVGLTIRSLGKQYTGNIAQFWTERQRGSGVWNDRFPIGRFTQFDNDSSGAWDEGLYGSSVTREFGLMLQQGLVVDTVKKDTALPNTLFISKLRTDWHYNKRGKKYFMHAVPTTGKTYSSITFDAMTAYYYYLMMRGDSTWWCMTGRAATAPVDQFAVNVATVPTTTTLTLTAIPAGIDNDSMLLFSRIVGPSTSAYIRAFDRATSTITTFTAHGIPAGSAANIPLNYGYGGYDFAWFRPIMGKYMGAPRDSVKLDSMLSALNTASTPVRRKTGTTKYGFLCYREYDSAHVYFLCEGPAAQSDTTSLRQAYTLPRYGYPVAINGTVASDSTNSVTLCGNQGVVLWKTAGQITPDPPPPASTSHIIKGVQIKGTIVK